MSESRTFYLIDRTRVENREDCGMLRFLGFDFDGDGLDSEQASLPLLSGIAIHAAHARLLAGQAIDGVIESIISDYVAEITQRGIAGLEITKSIIREQKALLEGMLRMWATIRLPRILEEYDVVSIEQTWDWELIPGLVQRLRLDALLRRKGDGLLHILDYKTVGYPSEVWMEKFEHNLQTCLYLQALKEKSGEPVGGILYEGIVKGQFKKDTAFKSPWYGQKIQQSPYTIGYALSGDCGTIYQSDYTSKKGYNKVRPFEAMSMEAWVNEVLIPEGKGNDLFIIVPAICPPDYELLRVKDQVIYEELKYHRELDEYRFLLASAKESGSSAVQDIADRHLARVAPIRTNRCYKFGMDHRCKFIDVCFNQGADPLNGGGYVKRMPHHDTDLRMIA